MGEIFLHFIYGLAFFSLGLVVWLETLRPITPEIKPAFRKLAAYGLLGAAHHWIETWAMTVPESVAHSNTPLFLDVLTMTLSLLYLATFGAMLLSDRKVVVYGFPAALLVIWGVVGWINTSTQMNAAVRHDWLIGLAQYLILIPASSITAWGFARGRALAGEADKLVRVDKLVLAGLFAADAVFSGGFVAPATFFPANRFNADLFQDLTGVSILVIRSSVTVAIAVFVIRLQRVFEEASIRDRLARESMEYDARLAADIQTQLIPSQPLLAAGAHVHAVLLPSRIVGGDIYDYRLTQNEIWFMIADTAGKGAPASVLATAALIALDSAEAFSDSPEDFLMNVNKLLEKRFPYGSFITMLIGRYSRQARTLELASAGHMPPFLYRAVAQGWEPVDIAGSHPLGIFIDSPPSYLKIETHPGDRLLLYTDGLIDARLHGGRRLGENGALEWLNERPQTSAEELLDQLADFMLNQTGAELADDVAALLFEVR